MLLQKRLSEGCVVIYDEHSINLIEHRSNMSFHLSYKEAEDLMDYLIQILDEVTPKKED